jgi:hypothetical protein
MYNGVIDVADNMSLIIFNKTKELLLPPSLLPLMMILISVILNMMPVGVMC